MISGLMNTCGSARLVLLGEVHGHDALRHADLDRRQPDAGRVVHGLEHVLDQRADLGVDLLDRLGDEPQPLVGQDEDVAQRHGGDVRARARQRSIDSRP